MSVEILVLVMLVVFGLLYNLLVEYVQEQLPKQHGVTAWLVAGGVLITLVGLYMLTDLRTFLLAVLCFACSGIPMIAGSMGRFFKKRSAAR